MIMIIKKFEVENYLKNNKELSNIRSSFIFHLSKKNSSNLYI